MLLAQDQSQGRQKVVLQAAPSVISVSKGTISSPSFSILPPIAHSLPSFSPTLPTSLPFIFSPAHPPSLSSSLPPFHLLARPSIFSCPPFYPFLSLLSIIFYSFLSIIFPPSFSLPLPPWCYRQHRFQSSISHMFRPYPITVFPVPGAASSDTKSVVQDRKSTRLNSSHVRTSRMPSSAWKKKKQNKNKTKTEYQHLSIKWSSLQIYIWPHA